MKLEYELLVNQYGQGIASADKIVSLFDSFTKDEKKLFIDDLLVLIFQSKPIEEDITLCISESGLKSTYTPCVLLKKGNFKVSLYQIAGLPADEQQKVLILFLHLFKIAYERRWMQEKDQSHKWWYSDLSNARNIEMIVQNPPYKYIIE